MNQVMTENLLERSVETVMQPERCYVRTQLEERLPGHSEKKRILTGLNGYDCNNGCSGYNSACHGHWNNYVTSEITIANSSIPVSIETAIARYIPKMEISPKAIQSIDPNTCTWLISIVYKHLTDSYYKPNGELAGRSCRSCEGHLNAKNKSCYMRRTAGLEHLEHCLNALRK